MGKITFESDSSIVKIIIQNEKVNFSKGKSDIISVPVSKIKSIQIRKRSKPFKPDVFFVGYGIFTEIIGISALYLLFRTTNAEYFIYGAVIFLIVSLFYFGLIIKMANKRNALFIATEKEVFEFPVNKTEDFDRIGKFFEENGITVSLRVQY